MREKCCTNLLSNTSCFTFLNVSSSNVIQKGGFTSINVTKNGTNWASELSLFSFEINSIISQNAALFFLFKFISLLFFGFQLFFCFLSILYFCFCFHWAIFLSFELLSDSFHFFFLFFGHMKPFFLFKFDTLLFFLSNSLLLFLLLSLSLLFFFSQSFLFHFVLPNFSLSLLFEFLLFLKLFFC